MLPCRRRATTIPRRRHATALRIGDTGVVRIENESDRVNLTRLRGHCCVPDRRGARPPRRRIDYSLLYSLAHSGIQPRAAGKSRATKPPACLTPPPGTPFESVQELTPCSA